MSTSLHIIMADKFWKLRMPHTETQCKVNPKHTTTSYPIERFSVNVTLLNKFILRFEVNRNFEISFASFMKPRCYRFYKGFNIEHGAIKEKCTCGDDFRKCPRGY